MCPHTATLFKIAKMEQPRTLLSVMNKNVVCLAMEYYLAMKSVILLGPRQHGTSPSGRVDKTHTCQRIWLLSPVGGFPHGVKQPKPVTAVGKPCML